MPLVRRLEHARRDARQPSVRARRGRAASQRRRCPVAEPLDRRSAADGVATACRAASASSIACSAAAWCRARSCCSAASRASASRRSCLPLRRRHRHARRRSRPSCTPRARSRPTSSACAPRGSAWPASSGGSHRVLAETTSSAIVGAAEATKPALLIVDSVQTLTSDELEGPAGSVGQVREQRGACCRRTPRASGVPVIARRPRDQGRQPGRAQDARAPRRRRADARGRALRPATACCARPRTASARPRRSASSRWRPTACARSPTRARAFLRVGLARRPGCRRRRHARGQPAAAGRGPGAGRADARCLRRGGRSPASTASGWRCCWPFSAGAPASAWPATTSTPASSAA